MFSQVASPLDRSRGGLGIGLALVRDLTEMHGGSVAARSEGLGKGSEFIVRLPHAHSAQAAPPASKQRVPPRDEQMRRILVVDDNRDSADSLAALMRVNGSNVQIAYDGLEAVEKARAFRPELVVLDIGMPRMDGYQTCRAMRNQAWGRDICIVALTGWGQEEDRRKSREAGFDAHLVKPVDHAAMMDLLGSIRSASRSARH
jgi:CheY-like chemotaxis protein